MPMISLPKVVGGVVKTTFIEASEIKGIEPSKTHLNGVEINCTKVYGPWGMFKVYTTPAMLYAAKQHAISTGENVTLPAGANNVLPQSKPQLYNPNKNKVFVPNKHGNLLLGKGDNK